MYRSRAMKSPLGRIGLISSLFLAAACGGSQPKPVAPEGGGAGTGATLAEPGATAPDLTAVQAPADLVAYGRLANPGNVIDTTAGWAKLPLDVKKLVDKNEPDLGRLLAYDAPIEFAVALDPNGRGDFPQPFAVFSVGITDLQGGVEFAKKQGASVRMTGPGTYRVEKGEGPSCALSAAVGKAPARLVCGERPEDLEALLPYATRGLPTENMGNAELHIELRAEPIRRKYSKELRQLKTLATPFVLREMSLDSPRFDRALADAVHGLTDELLALTEDVDRISVDAWVKKDVGAIDMTMGLKFRGSSSWTVQTMLDANKRAKAIPPSFWKLPKDARVATYGVGANPKRYEPLRKTLMELVDGALEKERVPSKVRDQINELLQETWTTEGAVSYAHGELPTDLAALRAGGAAASRERIRAQIGWYVGAVEEKSTKYKPYFDKLAKLYNDAQLRTLLDKRAKVKKGDLPKLTARAGKGLPAGSAAYELVIPGKLFKESWTEDGKAAKPAASLAIVLLVVPDGDRTWFGFSADEKVVTQKLLQAKKGESTLETREGLAELKAKPSLSGGFLTVASLMSSLLSGMSASMGGDVDPSRITSSMPNRGETPMLLWTSVSEGASPSMSWTVRVPRQVIEDVAAAAPALGAGMGAPTAAAPPPPPRVMTSPRKLKVPPKK